MVKLSSLQEYRDGIFYFLKFTQKQFAESLQSGTVYMNNFNFFINKEAQERKKGMGDILEVAGVMNNLEVQMVIPETNEVFAEGIAARMTIRFDYLLTKPVFCMSYIDADSLEIIGEIENYYETRLVFTDEQKQRFTEDFGDHVLIIPAFKFIDKLDKKMKEQNLIYVKDKVRYDDFSINTSERIRSYLDQNSKLFFWKDKAFEYQKEYRIVVLNKDVEENLILDIGNISEFTKLMTTEDFFSDNFKFYIRKK